MKKLYTYPEITVGAIIINPNREILLCKSQKWNNQYVIPGGHIEKGERMEDALRREVKEETGLEIYDIELISLQESIFSPQFHSERHFIFIDYCCKTNSFDVILNEEADSYAWVLPDKILSYDLGGYTRQFFTEYLDTGSSYKKSIFYQYAGE
ncbi:NUDIX domain-containing protein [Fulvivirga sp. M361]|uniref:NUDIX domain-containing protein n=1 Tax=Fulvivirga sp. M361 TaxID=2594266 RepID=UPI00117B1EE3|nr:NUDIX domain-containing protein [Fulvivirga sp. M361]TRX60759.1 NUDIX domain-containing protein [Fulvivirga sp. M361]